MLRFTEQEVQGILSHNHLLNTAHALSKTPSDVTAHELIGHWKKFHANPHIEVLTFTVSEPPQAAEFCADGAD